MINLNQRLSERNIHCNHSSPIINQVCQPIFCDIQKLSESGKDKHRRIDIANANVKKKRKFLLHTIKNIFKKFIKAGMIDSLPESQ